MIQTCISTPLVYSEALTSQSGFQVWLKLECLQPSGSFKDRGMTTLCKALLSRGIRRVVCSSGGNAGLSVSMVGNRLGISVRVVVPSTTKQIMLDRMRAYQAEVTVHGDNWGQADAFARQLVQQDPLLAYVSPFDDPLLWEGHSSLVDELEEQPDVLVLSVGGGGLLCGVFQGLLRRGWKETVVVAVETRGTSCFGQSLEKGEMVRLETIESIATSLGASQVTESALIYAKEYPGRTISVVVEDMQAIEGCEMLLDHHRMLVEPACGASLSVLSSPEILKGLELKAESKVVVIVCGGSAVSIKLLEQWRNQLINDNL